jgi:hypothetical protein
MLKLKTIFLVMAGCLAFGGIAPTVSAQGWQDYGPGGGGGDYRRRDRDDDNDRGRRGRDDDDDRRWRGRDRDDDDRRGRGREWRGYYDRGRDCYYVSRRIIDRDGDVVIRRSRVCED